MIIIMCSAISEADACEVANTHGRDGLDKVIEALRAFKVAVTKDYPLAVTGRTVWHLLAGELSSCFNASTIGTQQDRPHSL